MEIGMELPVSGVPMVWLLFLLVKSESESNLLRNTGSGDAEAEWAV
jgi:hypothetical protein